MPVATGLAQSSLIQLGVARPGTGGVVSLMALNDFEFGSDGDLVTAAGLNGAEQGTAWTWTQSRTPLGHTRISTSGNDNFTLSATVNGVAIPTNGTRRLKFDLSEGVSDALSPLFDVLTATAPSGIRRSVVCGFVRVAVTEPSGETTAMDLWEQHAGPYLTLQLNRHGFWNLFEGTAGELHIETQHNSGLTTRGLGIPINANTTYFVESCWDNVTGEMGILVRDSAQDVLIGTSGLNSNDANNSDLISLLVQTYLVFYGGSIQHDKIGRIWGTTAVDAPFPLFALTVPVPSSVVLTQVLAGALTLTWTAHGIGFTIERSSNAGSSWSTIESYIEAIAVHSTGSGPTAFKYVDDTVADGSTYRYRITATIGSASSATTSSSDVLVDDASTPVAADNFNTYTNANALGDVDSAANWAAGNGTITVYNPSGSASVYCASGALALSYARSLATFDADHRSEIVCTLLTPGSFGFNGVAVRCQSGADSAYGFMTDGTNWYLMAHIAGTSSTLASGTHSVTSGVKIDLAAVGASTSTRLTARVDTGGGYANVSGAVNIDPGGGKYLDGGSAGVAGMLFSSSGNNRADNWKGFNI